MRWLTPSVTIETCDVRLVVNEGLEAEIGVVRENWEEVVFNMTLKNVSSAENIEATWMVWPRPEIPVPKWNGVVRLRRDARSLQITLPRDIFYRSCWLHVVASRPFELDASTAVRFPPLS
jgi:hypothetical protein